MFHRVPQRPRTGVRAAVVTLIALGVGACATMQGVNVGTGMSLPGGVGVRANKTIGTTPANPTTKKKQDAESSDAAEGDEEAATSQQPVVVGLKLYVFDCGRIRTEDVSSFGLSNDDTRVRELFVPCYLIDHPRRTHAVGRRSARGTGRQRRGGDRRLRPGVRGVARRTAGGNGSAPGRHRLRRVFPHALRSRRQRQPFPRCTAAHSGSRVRRSIS